MKYPVATLSEDGLTFELGGRTFSISDEMLRDKDGNQKNPVAVIAELNAQIRASIIEDAINDLDGQSDSDESFRRYLNDKGLNIPAGGIDEIKKFLKNDRLKITLLVFDIDEYRIKGKSRSGYICFDRIPTKLIKEIAKKQNPYGILLFNLVICSKMVVI